MDSQGARIWRVLPYLTPFAVLGGAFVASTGTGIAAWIFLSIIVFHLLGMLPLRQGSPRNTELELGPGFVKVTKAGFRNQKIRAKDITGGTSARTRTGFSFTMQHRKRSQPITLEVDTEEELGKIRHALGVGHGGFGEISWGTTSDSNARTAWSGRAVAVACTMLMLALLYVVGEDAIPFDMLLGMAAGVGGLLGLTGLASRPPLGTVVMTAEGLRLFTPRGWFSLPYQMLAGIEEHKRGLLFQIAGPYPPVGVESTSPLVYGLSDAERKTLVAQINSSAQRARGMGPQKDDIRGRVEMLRRGGDNPRSWLQRLDMAGQMLSSGGAGYRGQTLDVEDLWAILEDPEAEPELRAGAARVLKHAPQPETRARIDAAVAAVRDEKANKRIRVAIKDNVDEAADELLTLEYDPENVRGGSSARQYR